MTTDARVPFDEAFVIFQKFLASQGWNGEVRWLTRDRITGHRRTCWVYRPEELVSCDANREYYESGRAEDYNLRIEALGQLEGFTLAYVERGPGHSRRLNFSVSTSPFDISSVNSMIIWILRRGLSRIRGETPFLAHSCMLMASRAEL
jgi:hypothetical protein